MAEQFIHVSENSRKAYLVSGISMQRCIVLDANDQVISGRAWLEEIVQSDRGQELLVLKNPPVDAYRKSAEDDWQDPKWPK